MREMTSLFTVRGRWRNVNGDITLKEEKEQDGERQTK